MTAMTARAVHDGPTTALYPIPYGLARASANAFALNPAKRLFDAFLALPLLVLALPAMLAIAAWIRAVSPGFPVLVQVRLGLRGRPFALLKLRTMRADCEAETGPRWSAPGDPRIIPGGEFLRRWHLDELPQLWNVLRGQMSLVGPRPERPEIHAPIAELFPEIAGRLAALPGMTGLAQVALGTDSSLLGFRRKCDLDRRYIREGRLALDLRILYWTALKLLGLRAGWVYPRVGHD